MLFIVAKILLSFCVFSQLYTFFFLLFGSLVGTSIIGFAYFLFLLYFSWWLVFRGPSFFILLLSRFFMLLWNGLTCRLLAFFRANESYSIDGELIHKRGLLSHDVKLAGVLLGFCLFGLGLVLLFDRYRLVDNLWCLLFLFDNTLLTDDGRHVSVVNEELLGGLGFLETEVGGGGAVGTKHLGIDEKLPNLVLDLGTDSSLVIGGPVADGIDCIGVDGMDEGVEPIVSDFGLKNQTEGGYSWYVWGGFLLGGGAVAGVVVYCIWTGQTPIEVFGKVKDWFTSLDFRYYAAAGSPQVWQFNWSVSSLAPEGGSVPTSSLFRPNSILSDLFRESLGSAAADEPLTMRHVASVARSLEVTNYETLRRMFPGYPQLGDAVVAVTEQLSDRFGSDKWETIGWLWGALVNDGIGEVITFLSDKQMAVVDQTVFLEVTHDVLREIGEGLMRSIPRFRHLSDTDPSKVIRLYLDISEGGAGGLIRPWEGRFLVGI